MVEVFKTNIKRKYQSENVKEVILKHNPLYKITFDLQDRDNVLRIESVNVNSPEVVQLLAECGFECEALPD